MILNMIKDFFNFFLLLSALHGFLFCTVLFFSKNGKKRSIVFINFLVLAISLNNFQSWVLAKSFFQEHLFLRYFEIPWHFLAASFFYMFLIYYLEIEKKYFNVLKVVLFIFSFLLLVRFGFYYADYGVQEIAPYFKKYTVIEEVLSIILSLAVFGYSYYLYRLVKNDKTASNIISFDNLKWINTFFRLGLLGYLFWILPLIITIYLNFNIFLPSYYPLRVFTTILIYWLGYQSVMQIRVLNERKYLRKHLNSSSAKKIIRKPIIDSSLQKEFNDKLNIPDEITDSVLRALDVFEKHQEYTSPQITLNFLAKKFNTNTNYLSKIINHYKKTSFTNYLNTLRIDNIIKELKENPIIRKFTIKAIAQEAGYNNADSFSKTFFKLKGIKPSDYIKNMEKNTGN
ncbi:MAG: helix-turn-helix domain-containing protein [Flavobacteriaceae bacterium]|nr:MAG: helix-turn-helix domain-containing protein [Flavobacteriaceae bacterium]